MERMLVAAAAPVFTNIGLVRLPDDCEVYPFPIPDLFCGSPLIISGKFNGKFPDSIIVMGLMPNQSTWQIEVPSRNSSKPPLNRVFAKQQLDLLTGQAWLYGNKSREQEAVNLSLATGLPCQYTRMIGLETTREKFEEFQSQRKKGKKMDVNKFTAAKIAGVVLIGGLVVGFGSVAATLANSAIEDTIADSIESALGSLGGTVGDWCDCCLRCFEFICTKLECLCGCECCECCEALLEGCECFLGSACELIFGCLCGLLDM